MPFHAVFTRTLRYVKRSKKLQRQDATHLLCLYQFAESQPLCTHLRTGCVALEPAHDLA